MTATPRDPHIETSSANAIITAATQITHVKNTIMTVVPRVNLTHFRDHSGSIRYWESLSDLTQTVANSCERLRTVAKAKATFGEHSLAPRPPKWNPGYAFGNLGLRATKFKAVPMASPRSLGSTSKFRWRTPGSNTWRRRKMLFQIVLTKSGLDPQSKTRMSDQYIIIWYSNSIHVYLWLIIYVWLPTTKFWVFNTETNRFLKLHPAVKACHWCLGNDCFGHSAQTDVLRNDRVWIEPDLVDGLHLYEKIVSICIPWVSKCGLKTTSQKWNHCTNLSSDSC